jgi:two-component system NarL family sensor kinase
VVTRSRGRSGRWVVAGPVLQFAVIGLIAAAFVGSVTAIASRRIGEREAVVDARTTAILKAQGAVEPAVTPALATGDPASVASIGAVVDQKVIDTQLVRVKIWRRDGTSALLERTSSSRSALRLERG